MEKKRSYTNKNFEDYRKSLLEYVRQYYPDLATSFSDSSIGKWLIDMNADVADSLSYHMDRTFQETDINSASRLSSVMAIARSNGFKVPGPKGAMAEVEISCLLPVGTSSDTSSISNPNQDYAPVIKKGSIFSSGNQTFELTYDVDFNKQFNVFGYSDRTIVPVRDSQGNTKEYKVKKLAVVTAGETKVYTKKISSSDIVPFMEVTLPGRNIMSIESIIVKPGQNYTKQPTMGEFLAPEENSNRNSTRFFEVDSLSEQTRWGDVVEAEGKPAVVEYEYKDTENPGSGTVYAVTKGEWKPVRHKFITEYTDNGNLKIIFGSGTEDGIDGADLSGASAFSRYQMTRMLRNSSLGLLPEADSTMYILYRVGGGAASNVPKDSINNIVYLKFELPENSSIRLDTASAVKRSVSVRNTTPSVSGKDMPTPDELRNMIKYYNSSKGRCVTLKDYKSRILQMPPKYGTPFRVGVMEENNKVMVYLLGVDSKGKLSSEIPYEITKNIEKYLSGYRTLNDFVEIKSGKIIDIGFDIVIHTDKNYIASDVKDEVRRRILDYMDVNRRDMGEDIYVGDIIKEISSVDGVLNLVSIKAVNYVDGNHSSTQISQIIIPERNGGARLVVDLDDSENILYSDGDSMIEVKLEGDINITAKPI